MTEQFGDRSHETIINHVIAGFLRDRAGLSAVAETLRPRARPDIIVRLDSGPVVVETEVDPARMVDADALSRLGMEVDGHGVHNVFAVSVPIQLRDVPQAFLPHPGGDGVGVQAVGLVHAPGAPTALSGPARVDFVDRLADPYQMLSEAAAIVPCTFNAPMPLVAETVRLRVQLLPTFRRARATPVAEFASRFIQCYGYMDPLVGIDTESDHNFPPRKGWAGADRALLDLSTRTCSY